MKKRLESELISIAHRILKLKNKSEVDQLYHETQKLYETLSVLKFYNDNFEQLKSVLSSQELEEKLEISLAEKTIDKVVPPEVVAEIPAKKISEIDSPKLIEEELQEKIDEITTKNETDVVSDEAIEEVETESDLENEDPIIVGEIDVDDDDDEENSVDDSKNDLDFEPIFELAADSSENELAKQTPHEQPEEKIELKKQEPQQISFEDLLGQNYSEPIFVKPNDIVTSIPKKVEEEKAEFIAEKEDPKPASLNEKLSAGINVGLNDRIAFVKNLFGDSNEDYNRVISQLNTFDALQEAQEFIEDMVKPDYNDWKGKEEYEERFMEIVAKKFA